MEKIIERIADVKNESSTVKAVLRIISAIALSLSFVCAQAWLVMLLWNWAMVGLFGISAIGFWTAFVLRVLGSVLCKLLFKKKATAKK